jgi:hypothetical protein
MSDINELITNVKSDLYMFDSTSEANIISLISTIESQKEELESKENFFKGYDHQSRLIESQLRDQIQSQKEEMKRQREAIEESIKWISPSSYAYELLKKSLQEGEK